MSCKCPINLTSNQSRVSGHQHRQLKGGIVKPEQMVAARQWVNKHVSMATVTHATIEDLLFSMQSVPTLCSEDERGKFISCS
jgi:hypothetical protein